MADVKIRAFLEQPCRIGGDGEEKPEAPADMTIEERIGERLRRLRLNDRSLPSGGDRWFESMPYSRLGSYAEECIARDEL